MAKGLVEKLTLRRAAIYANPGAPTDTLKRVYGDLTTGEQGVVPCVEIQKWNGATHVFQIADHPIHTDAPTVFSDNVVASGYTFSASNNFEGQGAVATLTFTADRTGQQISVRCKGALNASAALIENLAEIIRDALVTTHGLAAEWDGVTYSRAFNDCAKLGYVGGGVILDDADPVTLAHETLRPLGGAYVDATGRLQLYIETAPSLLLPAEIIPAGEIARVRIRELLSDVINQARLQYRFNWRKRAFASLERHFDAFVEDGDAQSQLEFKIREPRGDDLEAPWLRSSTAASAALDTFLGLRARPRYRFELALTGSRGVLLQPADVVAFTHARVPGGAAVGAPGDRRLMRVRRASIGLMTGAVTLHGTDLAKNWWITAYKADGTYTANGAIRAGGNTGPAD